MKKILISALLFLGLTASAVASPHHRHVYHHRHHGGPGWYWVAPLVIGGIAGAAIANAHASPAPSVQLPPGQPATITTDASGQQVVQCPGTQTPFEFHGWVRTQYGQYVQQTFIRCQ